MKNNPLKISEYSEQCLVAEYLDILKSQGKIVLYTAVPNSTWTPSWSQKIKNKKSGLNPGFPDLIILTTKKAICIEMKVGKNNPTKEQEAWHKALNNVGIDTWTAWSFDGAKTVIDRFI